MFDLLSKEKRTIHAWQVLNESEKKHYLRRNSEWCQLDQYLAVNAVWFLQILIFIPISLKLMNVILIIYSFHIAVIYSFIYSFCNSENSIQSYIHKVIDTSKMSILSKLKLFLWNLVQEIRPIFQNGLSTVKTDFLHHYVIGLVGMTQKHLTVFAS